MVWDGDLDGQVGPGMVEVGAVWGPLTTPLMCRAAAGNGLDLRTVLRA